MSLRRWMLGLVVGVAVLGLGPSLAQAHCDTMNGPVVGDARAALGSGDPTPTLKWVKKDAEPEIRAAFQRALAVRAAGGEARTLADTWFFETLVRLHRAGEGAPYTGLKPAGTVPAVLRAADAALDAGTIDAVTARLTGDLAAGMRARYARVISARQRAGESVEAGRAYVEAYVDYVHYVETLHEAAREPVAHDVPPTRRR